jgi:hypothetical protein
MRAIMAKETLVTFSDFTKEYEIHTDASKLQLGACISQGGKEAFLCFIECFAKKAETDG